jgi:hypothetical protein
MRKLVIIVGALVLIGVVVRRFAKVGSVDWEKIVEKMPDDAPPKWMFRNIQAIRENTERIRTDLEEAPAAT